MLQYDSVVGIRISTGVALLMDFYEIHDRLECNKCSNIIDHEERNEIAIRLHIYVAER